MERWKKVTDLSQCFCSKHRAKWSIDHHWKNEQTISQSCDCAPLESTIAIIKQIRKQVCYGSFVEIPSSYNLSHIPRRDNWKPQSTFLSCLKKKKILSASAVNKNLRKREVQSVWRPTSHAASETLCCTRRADICILNWILWKTRFLGQFCWTKTQRLALPPHQYLLLWGQLSSSEVVLKKIKVLKGSLPSSPSPLLARLQIHSFSNGLISESGFVNSGLYGQLHFFCFLLF